MIKDIYNKARFLSNKIRHIFDGFKRMLQDTKIFVKKLRISFLQILHLFAFYCLSMAALLGFVTLG